MWNGKTPEKSSFSTLKHPLRPPRYKKPCGSRTREPCGDHKSLVNGFKDIKPQPYKHCPGPWTWEDDCHAKDRQQERGSRLQGEKGEQSTEREGRGSVE